MFRSFGAALLATSCIGIIGIAGCSPRVERLDIFNGLRGGRPPSPAPLPQAREPLTIRVEISPRQATLEAPTFTLEQIGAPPLLPGAAATPPMPTFTLSSDSPSAASSTSAQPAADVQAYAITIPPGGPMAPPYGSTWRLDLRIVYRSWGASGALHETREFTMRAPSSCVAFDEGLPGEWSIPEGRIGYGASLDDVHRWPQDTQTRFLTRVVIEPDSRENFPTMFRTAPGLPFGSARFGIGGDRPDRFREWLVNNPYIGDKKHWIAEIATPPLAARAFTVSIKSSAEHPLRVRARAYCTTPGPNGSAPLACAPDHMDSTDASVEPGPEWRTVPLPIDTSGFPAGGSVHVGRLLVLGDAADAERSVWIDMVCQ